MKILYWSAFLLLLSLKVGSTIVGRPDVPGDLYEEKAKSYSSVCQVSGFSRNDLTIDNFGFFSAVFIDRETNLFITSAFKLREYTHSLVVHCQKSHPYFIDEASIRMHPSFSIQGTAYNQKILGAPIALFQTKEKISKDVEEATSYRGPISTVWDQLITIVGYGRADPNIQDISQAADIMGLLERKISHMEEGGGEEGLEAFIPLIEGRSLSKQEEEEMRAQLRLLAVSQPVRACEMRVANALDPKLSPFLIRLDVETNMREPYMLDAEHEDREDAFGASNFYAYYAPEMTLMLIHPTSDHARSIQSFSGRFLINDATPELAGQPHYGDEGAGYFNEQKQLIGIHAWVEVLDFEGTRFLVNRGEFIPKHLDWIKETIKAIKKEASHKKKGKGKKKRK